MKLIFLFLFPMVVFVQNNQMISDVQTKNNWIIIFNEKGKEISRMAQGKYEVAGMTGSFFVVKNSNWIITFNEKCKEIARMALGKKEIKGAAGETFTVVENSWIITFGKNCKEKSRRAK